MSTSQHPVIIINFPGQPSRQVQLDHDSYTLGRSPDCDIIIAAPVVSRKHGLLERKGGNWVYTDLNSQNGSLVDGQRVQQVILQDGIRLQLGKDTSRAVMITFQLAAPAEGPEMTVEAFEEHDVSSSARAPETVSIEMIPELVVQEMGGGGQGYPLSKPVMRVGRAPDNDIVIPSKLVSNHHLQVDNQPGKVTITDLNSTNGTQVNGVRIPPNQSFPLQPGDLLRVGDLHGNSIQISYGGSAEGLRTRAAGKLDLAKLAMQSSVLIGRLPSCDLYMPHPSVSKNHAMITRQNGQIFIRDLGSRNGTFVNGARVTQAGLRDGDEIRVGPFRLLYDGRGHNLAGSRPLGHRLDALHLVRQVKGGVTILKDVSVSIQSSEFVALVGGSGAGKSTLMKALNGYEPATKGQMLIDGQDLYSRLDMYRTEMGYVPQDDIIHRELPVRLALWYAAKLRLPDASNREIDKAIEDALSAVEMTEHQNKQVKKLSGGQRKRVSIASELLAQPTLFFLDEPTSGLDPGLEKKMMYDLKRLADQGRTIVLVTHATTNIEQCDYVAFMANGLLAYYGPPKEAPAFFDTRDFADIYQKLSYEIDPARSALPQPEIKPDYEAYVSATRSRGGSSSGKVSASVIWAEHFHKSSIYQKYIAAKQASLHTSRNLNIANSPRPRQFAPFLFVQQMYYLARRHIDLIRNDVRTLLILLVMIPLIGLLFGVVSKKHDLIGAFETKAGTMVAVDIEKTMKEDLKNEPKDADNSYIPYATAMNLVVMVCLALTQGGTFAASYEIVKERAIFQRERAVNLSVWAYVLAKVLVLSMFAFIQVAGALLLLGLFVDLDVKGIIFPDFSILETFITLYLAVIASIAFGLFISAFVPTTDVVLYIILAQLFVQIVLSGTLFPLPSNPASYVSPSYWTTKAMGSIVDLPRLNKEARSCRVVEIPDMSGGPANKSVECESVALDEKDEGLDNYKHTEEHLINAWMALGAHLVVWTLLTVFVQSRKKAGKD